MKINRKEPVEYTQNSISEINFDLLIIFETADVLEKAFISSLLKNKNFTTLNYKGCSGVYVDIQQALCSSLPSPSGLHSLATHQTRGFLFELT